MVGLVAKSRNRKPLISKQSVEKIGIIFSLQHDLLWTQFSVKKENVNPKCMYNLSAIFSYSTILLHQGPYLMNILHSPLMSHRRFSPKHGLFPLVYCPVHTN